MNVSKEVKKELIAKLDNVKDSLLSLRGEVARMSELIQDLTVTEPAPAAPKHEWKVGDVFSFWNGAYIRRIILTSNGLITISPAGLPQCKDYRTVDELMNSPDYKEAIPVSLDKWFAAVRKVHNSEVK